MIAEAWRADGSGSFANASARAVSAACPAHSRRYLLEGFGSFSLSISRSIVRVLVPLIRATKSSVTDVSDIWRPLEEPRSAAPMTPIVEFSWRQLLVPLQVIDLPRETAFRSAHDLNTPRLGDFGLYTASPTGDPWGSDAGSRRWTGSGPRERPRYRRGPAGRNPHPTSRPT